MTEDIFEKFKERMQNELRIPTTKEMIDLEEELKKFPDRNDDEYKKLKI